MKNANKTGSLKKKAAAVALSFVMVFGMAAALPDTVARKGTFTTYAYNEKYAHTFYYEIIGGREIRINGIDAGDRTLSVPKTITLDGTAYTVTEIGDNFAENCSLFSIVIPDTVTKIGDNFAKGAPVDNITLSDNLEYIGDYFCYNCTGLKGVTFNGTKLKHIGTQPFAGEGLSGYHFRNKNNANGAVCFGNWLIAYYGDKSYINVNELGTDTKITCIASDAFTPQNALYYDPKNVTTVDLTDITYIADGAFKGCTNLEEIKGGDDVRYVGAYALHYTKWYQEQKKNDMCKLGSVLLWYKSDSFEIDLTKVDFTGISQVYKYALLGCSNATSIKARSTTDISEVELPKTIENSDYEYELNDLEALVIDNEEMKYGPSVLNYSNMLKGTKLEADMIDTKTKDIFKSIGVKYEGAGNISKANTRDLYEETKKIHDFISENYAFGCESKSMFEGYIGGKRMDSEQMASLYAYMLRCAGIEAFVVKCDASTRKEMNTAVYDHSWVIIKLGDDWYHSDVCWDSASQSNSLKYFMMSDEQVNKLEQHNAWELSNPTGLKALNGAELPECKVQKGDANGDGVLDSSDLLTYKDIIEGKAEGTVATDMDFDNDTDIKDMLAANDMLNKHPFEPTNTGSKPENMLMAKNARVFNSPQYGIGQGKVIIVGEDKIYSKDVLLGGFGGEFVLPEFNYKTSSYEKFDHWNLGKPGDTVQLTSEVTLLQPVWVDDSKVDSSLPGDVTRDGKVDIVDAVTIISHINGVHVMSNSAQRFADVKKDGKIDIEDAVCVINHVNGVKSLF